MQSKIYNFQNKELSDAIMNININYNFIEEEGFEYGGESWTENLEFSVSSLGDMEALESL